ncbi:MAG: tetraacyldisaccharide 4'-kinase [Burkholderiaceae bacterium]
MAAGVARPAGTAPEPHARAALEAWLQKLWFAPAGVLDSIAGIVLWPAAALVGGVADARRRHIAEARTIPRTPGHPPVVVVGNLVVGGTGKTPLLIALAQALAARGWRPGVIARGYGGRAEHGAPAEVLAGSTATEVGDEPLLVAQRTGLPVMVGRDRGAVLDALRRTHDCNVVLSDDGLQHRGLRRDVELAVFDARGAGNGHCLPAGPLREPLRGALLLDALVLNGAATVAPIVHSRVFRFTIEPTEVIELADGRTRPIAEFVASLRGETVDAVAGIGAPARFFDTLRAIGVPAREHALPDHSVIDAGWLAGLTGPRIVMTEKDAVKCSGFDPALRARCAALRVAAVPDAALVDWLEERLRG